MELSRYCPLCETDTDEIVCTTHKVPTLDALAFKSDPNLIPEGSIIAERYEVKKLLGKGGMGEVYLANQMSMDRRVALKTLRVANASDPKTVKRFYREARSASKMDHPNVVKIYDFGIDEKLKIPFIAMEFLKGTTLNQYLCQGGLLGEQDACELLAQVAKALVAAHSSEIVHRDLKPDNIHVVTLADGDRLVKVLDFGIARIMRSDTDSSASLTATGMMVGTPHYMSPEQIQGEKAGVGSDLYALGCMLYEVFTGQPPFDASEIMAVFMKHLNRAPPELPNPLPGGGAPTQSLRDLYAVLMAKSPSSRPPTAKCVASILRALSKGQEVNVGAIIDAENAQLAVLREENGQLPKEPPQERVVTPLPDQDTQADRTPDLSEVGIPQGLVTDEDPVVSLEFSPPRSTPWRFWGVGIAVALLGIALVVWKNRGGGENAKGNDNLPPKTELTGGETGAPEEVETKRTQPTEVQTDKDEAKPAEVPREVVRGSYPAKRVAPKLQVRTVTITSRPSGAVILEGRTRVGTTPYRLTCTPAELPRKFKIKKAGYKSRNLVLDEDSGDKLRVVLKRRVKPPPKNTEPKLEAW